MSSRPTSPNSNHIEISVSSHNYLNSFECRHILCKSCLSISTLYWSFTGPSHRQAPLCEKEKDGLNSSFQVVDALCQGHGWQAENRLKIGPRFILGQMSLFQPQSTHPYPAALVTQCLNATLSGVGLCLQNQTKPNQT